VIYLSTSSGATPSAQHLCKVAQLREIVVLLYPAYQAESNVFIHPAQGGQLGTKPTGMFNVLPSR